MVWRASLGLLEVKSSMDIGVGASKSTGIYPSKRNRVPVYLFSIFDLSATMTLRCVIPVVCVTNVREESVVKQHN